MTSLKSNLSKRIQRLPKPTNVAAALQPLFESISNAIHSTQAKFGESVATEGRVEVEVHTDRRKDGVWATVEDNGFGLNEENWEAFTTTDTDHKIGIGGKGVGRLMWLDCFEKIDISSVYATKSGEKILRSFQFQLANEDQIHNPEEKTVEPSTPTYFHAYFRGLRDNAYLAKFPGRGNFIFQHLTSHFLPTFIGNRSPIITVRVGDETRVFPEAISDVVHRKKFANLAATKEFGTLKLTLMECDKVASADLKGDHFVHFIAHDRTVHSQAIDGKLGLKRFGPGGDRVFHAILSGTFLDDHVNQERTAFTFEDAVIERIVTDVCFSHIEEFLKEPLQFFDLSNAPRSNK